MSKQRLKGIVTSTKMDKTVVVRVGRMKEYPKYKTKYKVHKKYKAHDQKEECHKGDKVIIEKTRPLSKDKKWRVVKRVVKTVKS